MTGGHCKMAQKRTSAPVVVSVICPIFNAAAYLEETLDSVLAQDFCDFELLLIDDGSSDSSGTIARRYAQRHSDQIRYFEHPENGNRGVGASRNLGIRHARGAFLAFIDSDDRWRPTKLREQLAIFDADPRVDLIAGTANYWRSWRGGEDRLVRSGHVQDTLIRPPEASLNVYPLAKASAPCPSDLLVRTKLARDIGGFEEEFIGPLTLYEDQAFLSKAYLTANVYFDERVWIDYRLHDESMMHQQLAAGRYHEVRKFFLEWFATYLRTKRVPHALRVQIAVQCAYIAYRPSWPFRYARKATRALDKLVRTLTAHQVRQWVERGH